MFLFFVLDQPCKLVSWKVVKKFTAQFRRETYSIAQFLRSGDKSLILLLGFHGQLSEFQGAPVIVIITIGRPYERTAGCRSQRTSPDLL